LALFGSCSQKEEPVVAAARAYDVVLSIDELSSVIPDNSTVEDSLRIAQAYINNWMREQVVLHHAELNLQEEQKDFGRQMEDYRKSLLVYAYESKLIEQKLDTVISEEAIEEYYLNNQDNFQLKDYIVRVKFCILDKETRKLRKFKNLFYSEDSLELSELEDFCIEHNARYFLREDKWMYFEDLLKEVPMEVFDRESFLKKNKNIEFEKGNKLYFLIIKDYKFKDSVSPLSLEKEKIRSILLNKRKNDLLSKMRNDLFNDAIRKKDVKEIPLP
jgi:hypothetical protein